MLLQMLLKSLAEIGETGTAAYKNYEEGEAARSQAAVLKSFNKQLPGLLNDSHKLLDSGKERNRAITSSVRQIANHYERLANVHVDCADTIQENARGHQRSGFFFVQVCL